MLMPTVFSSPLQIVYEDNNLYKSPFSLEEDNNIIDALGVNHHLYILSNDRINVGDYCYDFNDNRFFTCGASEDVLFDLIKPNVKKVIESTDINVNKKHKLDYASQININKAFIIYNGN